MASVYLDTSALLKLYIEEDGADRVTHIVEDAEDGQVVILDLTQVEARSAIRRREREGDISGADADRVLRHSFGVASGARLRRGCWNNIHPGS